MADQDEEYETKTNKKSTGKVKWLDTNGIGYLISDEDSNEYLLTPSSFSDTPFLTLHEGDCVKFTPKFRSSIPQFKAFNVTPFGIKCHYCRRFGHRALNCPQKIKSSRVKCHRCGYFGHFFWDCEKSVSGSIVCVKKREDVKRVEQVEDCFILEFNPYETGINGSNLDYDKDECFILGLDPSEVDEENDDKGCEKLRPIVCMKKKEDVKKVEEVEDCFILEFDPNEPVKISNLSLCAAKSEPITVVEEDLSILAEKGQGPICDDEQVACRDYPHPRHLCAKHPFKKTSHKSHSAKCYCYICYIPAPCAKWTSTEGSMHCHAIDEISMWRDMRQMQKTA